MTVNGHIKKKYSVLVGFFLLLRIREGIVNMLKSLYVHGIMYYVRTHYREQRKHGREEVCESRELLYLIFKKNIEEQAQYILESI